MSLTNPNKVVTEERLSNFYNRILPYLGGNDADSVPYDNTDSGLTSENVQDAIDELNESKASPLTNAEMTAIKNAFDATNTSKFATTYTKYSTEEQVVGEWIDGKPLYQKTIDVGFLPNNGQKSVSLFSNYLEQQIYESKCFSIRLTDHAIQSLPYTGGESSNYGQMGYFIAKDAKGGNDTKVYVWTTTDRTDCNAYLTICYTKTTD